MRNQRRRSGSRAGRLLWGGLALGTLVLLGLTFLLASGALKGAEAAAQERAERETASVLLNQVTPQLASSDVTGTAFRDLLEVVQARILDDDRVTRVRIWRPDGNLVFSTAPRDDLGEIVAPDDPQIEQAAAGAANSVIFGSRNGQLLRTFVPMRVADGTEPYAVAEIAQTYDAIKSNATRMWRVAQIVLVVAFGSAIVMLGLSFRTGRVSRPAGGAKPTRDERKLRDAEERARAAERAARQVEERLADAERRLKEAKKTEVPPRVQARLDELEMKAKAEAAEREQLAGEAERLRTALAAKEKEVALAHEGEAATRDEVKRSEERLATANQRAADVEKRLADAERRAADDTKRAGATDKRIVELENALRHAEERAARATADGEALKKDRDQKAGAELVAARAEADALRDQLIEMDALRRQAAEVEALRGQVAEIDALRGQLAEVETLRGQLAEMDALRRQVAELEGLRGRVAEAETVRSKLSETEASLAQARADLADRDRAVSDSGAVRAEAEGARAELEVARADLSRAQTELDTMRAELAEIRMTANAMAAQLEDARANAGNTTAELDLARARAGATNAELDEARSTIAALTAELEEARARLGAMTAAATASNGDEAAARISQLEARIADMEAQRTAEIAELQRAHESLANTQAELVQSNKKLRDAQDRARELERQTGTGPPHRSTRRSERGLLSETDLDAPASTTRVASVDDEPSPPVAQEPPPEPQPEPEAPELPDEPLSLRERLARAAAARHRPSGTPG